LRKNTNTNLQKVLRAARRTAFGILLTGGSIALAQQYTITTLAGGAAFTPVAALNASIGQPQRAAVDASGAVYFSNLNSVFKIDAAGVLTRIAGNGRAGFSGDGGPAAQAQLNGPQGVAVNAAGDVYIADRDNHRVREVTPDGVIATVAGNGTAGFFGDGGAATDGQLNQPTGLAVDASGNLYIADPATHCVREVLLDGSITTVAGNGGPGFSGYSGDGGAAQLADLSTPEAVAVDTAGNLYIVDTSNNDVRQVSTSVVITTVAGNQTIGYSGDGGASISAQLNQPYDVAVDGSGNLYILQYADGRIRKVSSKGIITTVAGNGSSGFGGDGGAATSAQLSLPKGVASDAAGNLYIADSGNDRIRKVSTAGTISTVAGSGLFSYSGDGSPAASAQLNGPLGAAVDASGNVYLADTNNHRVRVVSSTGVITTLAGNGSPGFGGDGGGAAAAQLNTPSGLAIDGGTLYIADTGNNRVRAVSPQGVITTVAGNGSPGYSGDGGAAANAQLYAPVGVAVDGAGNVYIAEFSNSRIRKVSPGGLITTVAGTGVAAYAGDGGPATSAYLNGPSALAVDAAGNLYIADTRNHCVREVTPDGVIITAAGTGVAGYSGDGGGATSAQLLAPAGVAVDNAGNLYITEASNRIRKVFLDGSIRRIAGNGLVGYSGDGGLAIGARLNGPSEIAVDNAGKLYVAEAGNNSIRLLQPTGQ
jgi:trimeric autotransporter adhesin